MKIKVIVKQPYNQPEELEIEDTLENWQKQVGGYIQFLPTPYNDDVQIICNEEGKIKRLQGNFMIPEFNDYIVGTAVFCSFDKQGELKSLTEEQIKQTKTYINHYALVDGQDINRDYETLSIQARKKMKQLMGAME